MKSKSFLLVLAALALLACVALQLLAAGPLTIVTNQMPDGVGGKYYTAQLQASGGKPPYRWAVSGLPAGMTVDTGTGVVSGTPPLNLPGVSQTDYQLQVQVWDSRGTTVKNALYTFTDQGDRVLIKVTDSVGNIKYGYLKINVHGTTEFVAANRPPQ